MGYDFKVGEHINVQELKALVDEVGRRVATGEHSCRIVMCCDSRVVVGEVSKGRSSSSLLNKHLRGLCALCMAHDIQLRVLWVGTDSNPSDAPSRHKPLPFQSLAPIGSRRCLMQSIVMWQKGDRGNPSRVEFAPKSHKSQH